MISILIASSLLLAPVAPAKAAPTRTAVRAKSSAAKPAEVLPFLADDWTRAVALARARKVPIFVEAWAPW